VLTQEERRRPQDAGRRGARPQARTGRPGTCAASSGSPATSRRTAAWWRGGSSARWRCRAAVCAVSLNWAGPGRT